MRHSVGKTIALVLLIMSLASIGWAQNDNNQNQKNKKGSSNSLDQEKPGQPAGGQAVGKDEAKAYKAFYDARNGDPMKVIELGEGFLAKYPMSLYAGAVYSTLTTAYLNTNQPDKMLTAGRKGAGDQSRQRGRASAAGVGHSAARDRADGGWAKAVNEGRRPTPNTPFNCSPPCRSRRRWMTPRSPRPRTTSWPCAMTGWGLPK